MWVVSEPEPQQVTPELFREQPYLVIESVLPASAAAQAGLQAGDRIIAINSAPIPATPDAFFAWLQTRPAAPEIYTVLREWQQEITITVTPVFDQVAKRPLLGMALTHHIETVLPEEQGGKRCASVQFLSEAGLPLARCDMEFATTETSYSEQYRRGGWTEQSKRGVELLRMVLRRPNDDTDASYDVLKEFNTEQIPIITAIQSIDFARAFHDPRRRQVVIPAIHTPGDLAILLHELRHTKQRKNPRLEKLMEYYGADNKFRFLPLWTPSIILHLPEKLRAIMEAIPEAERGVDEEMMNDTLPALLDRLQTAAKETEWVRTNADRAGFSLLHHERYGLLPSLASQITGQKAFAETRDELSNDERLRYFSTLREIGIDLPEHNSIAPNDDQHWSFSAQNIVRKQDISDLFHMITRSLDRRCLGLRYDDERGESIVTIGFPWGG